ncbi:MAG: hypothetical protein NZ750_05920 [Anaerolineae bacterium]|nr:hypothetical protein [Anaerolineae bacterium]MDW8172984.1 hypothetical protein [Anaerolineae bacterium]
MAGCWLIVCGAGVTVALFALRLLLWPLRLLWRGLRWLIESAFNWARGDGWHGNQHAERDPFERFDSDFEAALRRAQGRFGALPPTAGRGFASQSAALPGQFPAPSQFPAPQGQFPAPQGQFPAPQGQFPAPQGQFPVQSSSFPPSPQFPPLGQFPAPSPAQFPAQPGQVNPNFRRPNLTPGREYQPQPGGLPPAGQFPAQPSQFPPQPGSLPPAGQFPAQQPPFSAQQQPPRPGALPPLPPLPPLNPGGSLNPLDVDAERERQRRRDEGDGWGGDLLSGMDGLFGR